VIDGYLDGALAEEIEEEAEEELLDDLDRLPPEEAAVLALLVTRLRDDRARTAQSNDSAR
jgi:DNA topoisomerase-1